MPSFNVRYISQGRIREAAVDAIHADAVAEALGVPQFQLISLTSSERKAYDDRTRGGKRLAFPLKLFCQELAMLLDSGITLYDGIATLREKESSAGVAAVLDSVSNSLSQGQPLSAALACEPRAFPPLFIASIQASQNSGLTSDALRRHAEHLAWLDSLRQKMIGALIYPAVLVVSGLLVIGFLTLFVMPRFAQIYDDLGGDLPWLTRCLLRFSRGIVGHPVVSCAAVCGIAGASMTAWRTTALRLKISLGLWRLPFVGPRLRLFRLTAFYRALGLLLQAGVPIEAALQACQEVGGPQLHASIADATRVVRQGLPLSDALQASNLATPVSRRMLRVGEGTGSLGTMLDRSATFHNGEVAQFADWITKVINPTLMLVMGLLIGGIVVMMYLPIFEIAEQAQ